MSQSASFLADRTAVLSQIELPNWKNDFLVNWSRGHSPRLMVAAEGVAVERDGVASPRIAVWGAASVTSTRAAPLLSKLFQPKGHMEIDEMVLQSAVGPLGQPADQAMYPGIATTDGKPMNAQHDYVIRMTRDELPPAIAFWSLTLYDAKEGFFIPNKEKKYSVGENAGMKLNASGGIEVHVAAKQPKGVPAENWLPMTREDLDLDVIMRVYQPDLKKMKTWKAPKAELVK
jgi:hypothetical protein